VRRPGRALALLAGFALAAPAQGATVLVQDEDGALSLGGYARSVGGLQQLQFATSPAAPAQLPDHDGVSATVVRLEWSGRLGDRLSAVVHERAYLRLESETLAFGGQKTGIGASVVPRRSVNLQRVVYNEQRLMLDHDVDALAIRAGVGDFDVVVGRQAITWGVGGLFPVADLWTGFSPFELDTTQKRGIDAVRILYSQGRALELEAVVADRGTARDLSGGLRVATYGAWADGYVAVAKQWRELFAFTGVSATAGAFKLRAELAAPYDLDARAAWLPRASAGVDWLLPSVTLTLEGHFNGTGVARVSEYLVHRRSAFIQRGESYLLGRWYTGAAASWKMSELFQVAVTALCNVYDPSWAVAGALTYRISQGAELSAGVYQGVGRIPRIQVQPKLGSEFGSIGGVYYLALSTFF
jgi:hypothetical protein